MSSPRRAPAPSCPVLWPNEDHPEREGGWESNRGKGKQDKKNAGRQKHEEIEQEVRHKYETGNEQRCDG